MPCNQMTVFGGKSCRIGSKNPTRPTHDSTARSPSYYKGENLNCRRSTVYRFIDQHRKPDQLGHAANVQLFHEAAAMLFNGFNTEAQLSSHYLVRVARHDKAHHIVLTVSQVAQLGGSNGARLQVLFLLAAVGAVATN